MEVFIQKIAKKAGKAIFRKYGKIGVKYTKSDLSDVVTEADLIANDIIVKAIKKKYPTHAIISEETGDHKMDSEYCWIIDPLDGTRNFSTQTPMFMTMVTLVKNGEVELAAIYDICARSMYFAKKGSGAFKDGKRIQCSSKTDYSESWGAISAGFAPANMDLMDAFLKYGRAHPSPRWVGSLACGGIVGVYVAQGTRDWKVSRGGGVWDYAPTALIQRESGCKVTNLKGEEWTLKDREQVAANPHLHKILMDIINERS